MKKRLKNYLLRKLHSIERQQYDLTDAIVSRGVKGFSEFDFEIFKREILEYMKTVRVGKYAYKYAVSRERPCLYASIYAVMLEGLLGVLHIRKSSELKEWADYLNEFQSQDDGLYYDPVLKGAAYEHIGIWNEGWGKHHLMGHMIIALARLGYTPKYPLKYLEKYYDEAYLIKWMNDFDLSEDVWSASNYFMNLFTVLEYARDYLDDQRAGKAILTITDWLSQKQNPATGMWHDKDITTLDHLDKLKVVRAAYHFYPLFEYEGLSIPHSDKIVDTILPLQNRWGGWSTEDSNSGACEDIDAIEPLIRCAHARPERKAEIKAAILRSMIWQLACRNRDKGFSFYLRSQQEYGGHPMTTSLRDESSMFATWFRTLCLAYEMEYLGMPHSFDIGMYPGYEINIYNKFNNGNG